jgi:hypothetical protein
MVVRMLLVKPVAVAVVPRFQLYQIRPSLCVAN